MSSYLSPQFKYMFFHIFTCKSKTLNKQYDSVHLISKVVLQQFLFNRHLSSKLTVTCTSGVRFIYWHDCIIFDKVHTFSKFMFSYRNMTGSLGEQEMLWALTSLSGCFRKKMEVKVLVYIGHQNVNSPLPISFSHQQHMFTDIWLLKYTSLKGVS